MFRFIFNGNLGKDAEVKTLDNGSKVISLNVANTQTWIKNGEKQEKTVWINCSWWKTAEQSIKVADFLKKGTRVLIEGEPSARGWANDKGEVNTSLECRVLNLEFFGNGNASASEKEESKPNANGAINITPGSDDDDLPF